MPLNVNLENLTTLHGDKALDAMKEIADLGGFGSVGNGQGQIDPAYRGGLDVAGVLSEQNSALSEKSKDRIAVLAGVTRHNSADVATVSSSAPKNNKVKE